MNFLLKQFLAAIIWLFLTTVLAIASQNIIKGKVVKVGSQVKIEYQGEYAPQKGDPVEIGFLLGEDFAALDGKWKVTRVNERFAWVKKLEAGGEDPAENYIAIITSENPQKRQTVANQPGQNQNTENLFFENFDSSQRGWKISDNTSYKSSLKNGMLLIETKNEKQTRLSIDPGFNIPKNFSLEVDAIWQKGVKNKSYGFMIGVDKNNNYRFVITRNGYAKVSWFSDGKWMPNPIKWTKFIDRTGDGKKKDQLKIESRQDNITYYVNNSKIGTIKNTLIKKDWIIGLCVSKQQKIGFDNLKVTQLN